MGYMFAYSFFSQSLSSWNIKRCRNMDNMFYQCYQCKDIVLWGETEINNLKWKIVAIECEASKKKPRKKSINTLAFI